MKPSVAAAAVTATTILLAPPDHYYSVRADAPHNPNPFQVVRPSSSAHNRGEPVTITECLKGPSQAPQLDDCHGHTIIHDPDTGEEVYAVYDEESRDTVSSHCGVDDDECNPEKRGIPQGVKASPEVTEAKCGQACRGNKDPKVNRIIQRFKDEKKAERARQKASGGGGAEEEEEEEEERSRRRLQIDSGKSLVNTMQNLVLLIQFKDHKYRADEGCLPTKEEVHTLFNAEDGHIPLAPSGSVRDCFRYNSYFQFDLKSQVCSWCEVPHPEWYYGDQYYGMTGKLGDAIHHCLNECEAEMGGFGDFDVDGDGRMDAIAILHSGYGAEWGGDDDLGTTFENRIWSHKWEMNSPWIGSSGVEVYSYHISPALWGTEGCAIGRIGVICHETGHFFGLPDLYDGDGGNGVGTTCLMGNSWGYSGDQYYPPAMSAWARLRLGWADPVVLGHGTHHAELHSAAGSSAETNGKVYAIVNPANEKEYFLLENKQHHDFFEKNLPQTGMTIYHIDDEAAFDSEAYPGEVDWPEEHYRIAVVQPDGLYDLEKGVNQGDAGDVFHGHNMNYFGPDGVKSFDGGTHHPQPTTDWYTGGQFKSSGITISDISPSGPIMTFKVEITGDGGQDKDYDWGGDGRDDATCAGTKEPCENHVDCCSPPKRRCRLIKKLGRKGCVVKDAKKKKKRMRERQLRLASEKRGMQSAKQ